jgi:hypothetical protein
VTTPVHSSDTSDRENDSVVTDTSANFNAAVTDSIRNLCSIARADVPTTDDIGINDNVDPHITSHQGGSELNVYIISRMTLKYHLKLTYEVSSCQLTKDLCPQVVRIRTISE